MQRACYFSPTTLLERQPVDTAARARSDDLENNDVTRDTLSVIDY